MGLLDFATNSISSDEVAVQNLLTHQSHVIWVDIGEVKPDIEQPRKHFDEGEIETLAATIREHGILQPILVKENPKEWRRDIDKYIIVFGERRYKAALLAGVDQIPVMVMDVSAKDALTLQVIENVKRVDLLPSEEAAAYIRLQDEFNMGAREIARLVGKDHGNLSKMIRVFRDDNLSITVDAGNLPLTIAATLLPLPADERPKWIRNLIRRRNKGEEITVPKVTEEVRRALGKPVRAKAPASNSHAPALPAPEPPKGHVTSLFGADTPSVEPPATEETETVPDPEQGSAPAFTSRTAVSGQPSQPLVSSPAPGNRHYDVPEMLPEQLPRAIKQARTGMAILPDQIVRITRHTTYAFELRQEMKQNLEQIIESARKAIEQLG